MPQYICIPIPTDWVINTYYVTSFLQISHLNFSGELENQKFIFTSLGNLIHKFSQWNFGHHLLWSELYPTIHHQICIINASGVFFPSHEQISKINNLHRGSVGWYVEDSWSSGILSPNFLFFIIVLLPCSVIILDSWIVLQCSLTYSFMD